MSAKWQACVSGNIIEEQLGLLLEILEIEKSREIGHSFLAREISPISRILEK